MSERAPRRGSGGAGPGSPASLDVARTRLVSQRLGGAPLEHPADVVRWFGAVQAQDYLSSLWALGLRLRGATEAAVEAAVAEGSIVRTWPMRGTLHFVPAEDARWMLGLLTPRVISASAGRYRQLELDAHVFARAEKRVVAALEGGRRLTRPAIYSLLQQDGISTEGSRGLHILGYLAQRQVICFAGREGKQPTLALLDEWVKRPRSLEREEALAELAARYFQGHGPASVHDFAWWSGLGVGEAREAVGLVGSGLAQEVVRGRTLWFSDGALSPEPDGSAAYLLPYYDEYTVAYRDRTDVLDPAHAKKVGRGGILNPTVVIDGRVVGTWRRDLHGDEVSVQIETFGVLPKRKHALVARAAARYARFFGRTPLLEGAAR
jgi:hypothetical protein